MAFLVVVTDVAAAVTSSFNESTCWRRLCEPSRLFQVLLAQSVK